jgi:hypothetical protein
MVCLREVIDSHYRPLAVVDSCSAVVAGSHRWEEGIAGFVEEVGYWVAAIAAAVVLQLHTRKAPTSSHHSTSRSRICSCLECIVATARWGMSCGPGTELSVALLDSLLLARYRAQMSHQSSVRTRIGCRLVDIEVRCRRGISLDQDIAEDTNLDLEWQGQVLLLP